MKHIFRSALLVAVAVGLWAFSPIEGNAPHSPVSDTTWEMSSTIDLENSYVQYTGYKNVGKSHTGKIFFKSGTVELENGDLAGGEFAVDMNTITNEDIGVALRKKFVKHLKSDDFFDVENHSTSSFTISSVINKVEGGFTHIITGLLTIKGQTEEIQIPANISISGDKVELIGNTKIDRTKFGIKYASGNYFKDLSANKLVRDQFLLEVIIRT